MFKSKGLNKYNKQSHHHIYQGNVYDSTQHDLHLYTRWIKSLVTSSSTVWVNIFIIKPKQAAHSFAETSHL